MKVTLEKRYKDYYTISDLERAKAIIKQEREDDGETAKGWAEYAVREALKGTDDYLDRVIEADARTAKNCRAWNAYGDDSMDMDVYISATAKTSRGFIEVSAYLSDIWETGVKDYRQYMYVNYYKRTVPMW